MVHEDIFGTLATMLSQDVQLLNTPMELQTDIAGNTHGRTYRMHTSYEPVHHTGWPFSPVAVSVSEVCISMCL